MSLGAGDGVTRKPEKKRRGDLSASQNFHLRRMPLTVKLQQTPVSEDT